jgi:diguanylate cyclase (GGDEF)-like protein
LELVYRYKQWNDNYGHASGDALLRELAVLLRASTTDPADLVARNGGDEFCVVFADTEKSRAIERAERLRASIAEADFRGLHAPVSSGGEVRISASIGVACFPIDAQSPEALLEKADEAMYHSKKIGRNGVFFFWRRHRACSRRRCCRRAFF